MTNVKMIHRPGPIDRHLSCLLRKGRKHLECQMNLHYQSITFVILILLKSITIHDTPFLCLVIYLSLTLPRSTG